MKLVRPSDRAKCVVIGARFTGKHRISYDVHTGELSESLPPIHGHMLTLQHVLLARLPEARRHAWVEKIGVFVPAAVSQRRLNPTTGVMQ